MTNQSDVDLIAANLGNLPHPDGRPLMFPHHAGSWPGQPEEIQDQIKGMNQGIAEALMNLFEVNGKTIADKADLARAQQYGDRTAVSLVCNSCGARLLETTVDRQGLAAVPAHRLADINPECPHV